MYNIISELLCRKCISIWKVHLACIRTAVNAGCGFNISNSDHIGSCYCALVLLSIMPPLIFLTGWSHIKFSLHDLFLRYVKHVHSFRGKVIIQKSVPQKFEWRHWKKYIGLDSTVRPYLREDRGFYSSHWTIVQCTLGFFFLFPIFHLLDWDFKSKIVFFYSLTIIAIPNL